MANGSPVLEMRDCGIQSTFFFLTVKWADSIFIETTRGCNPCTNENLRLLETWTFFSDSLEGKNQSTRHHVTVSSNKHQDVNRGGHVTKIELELEEAPDDAILVESMPSELDVNGEINSTYPNGIPGEGAVIVRAEEALIVILVLLLWAAAIALFFNRWGKIRMLEPYQPKFQQQHRPSCATIDQTQLQNRRTYSKFNVLCGDYPPGFELNYGPGENRPRQNSVFIGRTASFLPGSQGTPRRTKSALDLQFLILSDTSTVDAATVQDPSNARDANTKHAGESSKLLPRERRTSACQLDRTDASKVSLRDRGMSVCHFDASPKSWQRDRGMSICQFDRMDVIARPLQRDRGGSICHFDRTDVLARPLQRDRIGSAYHFDRTEVLARPNYGFGKSLVRERRVSMCNFSEKDEEAARCNQKGRRSSIGDVDKMEKGGGDPVAVYDAGKREIFAKCTAEGRNSVLQYDQPCCSKTSDVLYGYKATRV